MIFVVVIAVIVIAGWLYLASNANNGARTSGTVSDDYVPVNAYDNPYDTNEANDAPFAPDACSDSSDDSSSDSGSDSDSCSDSSSD
ncbi:hypothetical protein [Lysobacter claricitrinus]|uniref:hypothetical protein n=1 Tax=Lysobacter claricitrinus TaxID=3367728 RepID=UPI0037DB8797